MKPLLKTLPVLLAALLWPTSTAAEKVLRPQFKDIRLWSNEKFVTHDFKMAASDPHLNLTLNVLQPLHNVDVHIEARLVKKQNPDLFFTVNATINLCRVLNYKMNSPVGALLAIYLKQYGRILEMCPIEKGTYYLHKFWMPEDSALSQFGELDFVFLFTAIHVDAATKKKTVIINDHYSGDLVAQNVKNFKPGFLALLSGAV